MPGDENTFFAKRNKAPLVTGKHVSVLGHKDVETAPLIESLERTMKDARIGVSFKEYSYNYTGFELDDMSCNISKINGCHAILVVFDTTDKSTFELAKQFIRKIKEFDKDRTIILVGTQTDLVNRCVVDSEMFKNYAEKANVVGFEVSVKKGENIDTLSEHLAKKLNPPTPQNNKTNEWHATAKYIRERADFQKIWDDSSLKNPKDKIFALLNDYTKNDSLLLRVLTFHWFRNEVTNVSTICSQSKDKNADELLQTLKKLKLTNPEGTLATIIELIEENMNKEPSTQARQSLAF